MPPTTSTIDEQLLIWRDIFLTAVNDSDTSGEMEALEEIDRLLEERYRIPRQERR